MHLSKKSILLVVILLVTGIASAHEIIQGDQCTVQADETVNGNLFTLCRDLVVDGQVNGNLIGAAVNVVINGEIKGDVYVLAAQFDMAGKIQDDLHFAGGILQIRDGTTFEQGDLLNLSLSTMIAPTVTIPGSVVEFGYQLQVDGTVDRDVSFWGSALSIGGQVSGGVDATVGDSQADAGWLLDTLFSLASLELINPGLYVLESGQIDGQLRYSAANQAEVAGTLAVTPLYTPVTTGAVAINLGDTEGDLGLYLSQVIREFISLALIGLAALILAPRLMQAPIANLRRNPFTSLGVGIPAFFLPLIALFIVILLTLLGMVILSVLRLTDLALVGGFISSVLSLSGISVFYFIAIFISRIIVCLALGQTLVRVTVGDDGSQRILFISLFAGIFVLAVLASLPTIGWVFNALALGLGLGAILVLALAEIRSIRERGGIVPSPFAAEYLTSRTLPTHPETARRLPPPMIEDRPTAPGTENLPEGFDWWDED